MADTKIPEEALAWLGALASNVGYLPLIKDIGGSLGVQLTIATLRQEFAQRSGLPAPEASRVISGLVNLLHMADARSQPIPEVLTWVTDDLKKNAPEDWRARSSSAWQAALPEITAALEPDGPLAILHKTLDLEHTHENVWLGAQILTDIRPVFSSDASRILRAVVTHMLAITYQDSAAEERTMHFALDSADIRSLQAACERALTKVSTIKAAVAGLPWFTEIAGETT